MPAASGSRLISPRPDQAVHNAPAPPRCRAPRRAPPSPGSSHRHDLRSAPAYPPSRPRPMRAPGCPTAPARPARPGGDVAAGASRSCSCAPTAQHPPPQRVQVTWVLSRSPGVQKAASARIPRIPAPLQSQAPSPGSPATRSVRWPPTWAVDNHTVPPNLGPLEQKSTVRCRHSSRLAPTATVIRPSLTRLSTQTRSSSLRSKSISPSISPDSHAFGIETERGQLDRTTTCGALSGLVPGWPRLQNQGVASGSSVAARMPRVGHPAGLFAEWLRHEQRYRRNR